MTESNSLSDVDILIRSTRKRLTDQQVIFADHFFLTGNQQEALEKAGYRYSTPKDKAGKASKVKNSPAVRAYLDARSQALIESSSNEVATLVKSLDKRNAAELEVYKAYQAIEDPKNATKFKYLELLMKLKGHLDTQNRSNLLIYQDNRQLNHVEIVDQAGKIMQKMQKLVGRKLSFADEMSQHE